MISFVLGNALSLPLADNSIHCTITSPPYWGLRDYGVSGQLGMEPTPDCLGWARGQPCGECYVCHLVQVFREVRRVLRDDGTLWLNLGDSYSSSATGTKRTGTGFGSIFDGRDMSGVRTSGNFDKSKLHGLKLKDLIGIPWRVAFALQADGWYLRQDIIWCLSGGAWVYARTQKGDMPVMIKDLVRLRPDTVQLWNGTKWTRVIGWGKSTDTSNRMELVLRSGERIGCTGGHLWPTQRGNMKASELHVGDTIQTCTLPSPDGAKLPGWLTPDVMWFVGLYLAEGSRSDDTVQLALNADESPWLERLRLVAEHLGGSLTHTLEGNSLNVRMYGRAVVAAVESYIGGKTASDVHLKASTWNLPASALRELATGYLDGDGHADEGRVRLGFCRNYSLERDLRTLAARTGSTLTLRPSMSCYQSGKKPSFRGEWRWDRSGHHNEKNRGEIVDIRASRARQFWDIAVEDEPHLFALASGVLTHNCKPNPMPESVSDRCTKAHEYVFLLTKSQRYYFDAEAIKEPAEGGAKGSRFHTGKTALHQLGRSSTEDREDSTTRNRRSVWPVATQPCKEAHFATFPRKLIEPMVLAGTSEQGCCPDCGKPWRRVLEKGFSAHDGQTGTIYPEGSTASRLALLRQAARARGEEYTSDKKTLRWDAACSCGKESTPCTVLDPFSGAGTTGLVCQQHGRNYVGIELNPAYIGIARKRLNAQKAQPLKKSKRQQAQDGGLFSEVA